MNFLDKLDILLKEKNINRHQLSELSDIPYMTIMNFYKKGTDNIKLSTLKKLSSFFEVSLDYIADDTVEDRYAALACTDAKVKQCSPPVNPRDIVHEKMNRLDTDDLRIIEGTIDIMLKADKYLPAEEQKNA